MTIIYPRKTRLGYLVFNTVFVLGSVINCKGHLRMSQEISYINIRKIRLNGVTQAVVCLDGIRKLLGLNLSRRNSFRNLSFPLILYALSGDSEVVL